MLPLVISGVVIIGFAALLMVVATRKGGSRKKHQKSRASIIREATRKLSQDPHNTSALIPLADLYFSEHLWDKAFPLYDTLLNIAAAHPEIKKGKAALRQGICAVNLDKNEEAFAGLLEAKKMDPDDFEVSYYLGLACYKTGKYENAVPHFKKAMAIKPDATQILAPLGISLYSCHHFKESLKYLRSALDVDPENKEVLFDLADAMQEAGYNEKALKVFMHLRPDPEFGARSCLSAGIMHVRMNAPQKAINDFEIGLKLPDTPQDIQIELHYRAAAAYASVNNIAKGLEHLRAIQVVVPNYKDVVPLIQRYQELNRNKNLQIYLVSATSDFVSLCRRIVSVFYTGSFVKIQDISVAQGSIEILCDVESAKWEDTEIFRFYRTTGAIGELYVRDFHSKIRDSKCDRGICITAGSFTDEAKKYTEGRPIDLIEKKRLIEILRKVDITG
jgi:tetratricopeptide (TPR) repeat protein